MTELPYGTWPSRLSAATIAGEGLRLGFPSLEGDDTYWLEGRPQEGGRNVLVRGRGGRIEDATPAGVNVRTRVHEYGGGAYLVAAGVVYYSNFTDQRVYRIDSGGSEEQDPPYEDSTVRKAGAPSLRRPGPVLPPSQKLRRTAEASAEAGWTRRQPQPLTPPGAWFYADYVLDARRRRLIAVREDHTSEGAEPVTTLVAIPLDGAPSAGHVLASGYDFYATPRLSPDGARLAWLSWRHPQMPWDGTELWVADVQPSGVLANAARVAGSDRESIYQPGWSPDGTLYFVSDRDEWWRLYRAREGRIEAVLADPPQRAEFGRPQWQLGTSTWAFVDASRMIACYTRDGRWHLASIDVIDGTMTDVTRDVEPIEWIAASAKRAVLVAGSASEAMAVIELDVVTRERTDLRRSSTILLTTADLSLPQPMAFPTENEQTAYAFYYAPTNAEHSAPAGERPPLIVIGHGGPTTATRAILDLQVQYWTSRGFAVVDVNYRGSSGYGRAYRQALRGRWGIADVADTINAARFLVSEGKADPRRLIVRGGSAGGYTTLAALTFHPDVFAAGASYYGISDLEVLARETHKFEARYLDSLVGLYPEQQDTYRARSPIHFVDRLECALILLQGLEDKVVPPNQSQLMADAVRAKGLPVAVLMFEGEQHGFRKAETVIRCLEAELYFYGALFGFQPADTLPPISIDNLTSESHS